MDLLKSGWIVFKRRWPILIACLAVSLVGVSIYHATEHKNYTASTVLFLRAPDVKSSAGAYQGDLFSRQRAQTYVKMFDSESLAQMVVDKLGLTTTPEQLVTQVQASTVKDTVLMTVSATDSNPQRAANIANGYGAVLGDYVAKLENVENNPDIPALIQVVTTATAATAVADGYSLWMLITGAVGAGLLVALLLIWLLEHYDTKVRFRGQIEELTDNRVIGKIPKARALGSSGSVADAWAKSRDFRQAALRLSMNIESILQRLPKVGVPPVLAVVSAESKEGNTVVTRTLARALVDRGRTVGVVDLDPARVSQDDVALALGSTSDGEGAEDANRLKWRSGLAAGKLSPEGFETVVEELRPNCDVILVDTPAFAESAEAQVVVGLADAVLVVVRPNSTTARSLMDLTVAVEVLDTPLVGIAANSAKESATAAGAYA